MDSSALKILILGNEPYSIGGVPNYTRALAFEFHRLGFSVHFLFSGAWYRKYNWLFRPYLHTSQKGFPFEYAGIVNSPGLARNFGFPLMDVSDRRTEKLFNKYITKIKPDIIHINSFTGLPFSLIEVASKQRIKTFLTVHEYATLCQKAVMIDREGRPCFGPSDLGKCADCIEPVNIKKLKFLFRIENTAPGFLDVLVRMKNRIFKTSRGVTQGPNGNLRMSNTGKKELQDGLRKRLEYAIRLMNHHVVMNICVSSDVKRTMARFGVMENKLLVQPIGSILAANQTRDMHALHTPLVIGNIGGVGHYKGTHILLEAVGRIKGGPFILKIFGKYNPAYVKEIMKGKAQLPIQFMGAYQPEDIPGILDQVDIVVLPSICNDTAPQTIFESYSARIPIVASNTGGFPDFVAHGVNGYLFKRGDSQDLADTLTDLLAHPERIVEFSKRIPSLKTIPENAQELLSLYRTSLERTST